MSHIQDKGVKSKRFMTMLLLLLLVTIDYKSGSGMTPSEWLGFIQWLFGLWAVSEVGKSGAEAYRDK